MSKISKQPKSTIDPSKELCQAFLGDPKNPKDDVLFMDAEVSGFQQNSKKKWHYEADQYLRQCEEVLGPNFENQLSNQSWGSQTKYWTSIHLQTMRQITDKHGLRLAAHQMKHPSATQFRREAVYDPQTHQAAWAISFPLRVSEINLDANQIESAFDFHVQHLKKDYPILAKYIPNHAEPTLNTFRIMSYREQENFRKQGYNDADISLIILQRFSDQYLSKSEQRHILKRVENGADLEVEIELAYRRQRIRAIFNMLENRVRDSDKKDIHEITQDILGNLVSKNDIELSRIEDFIEVILRHSEKIHQWKNEHSIPEIAESLEYFHKSKIPHPTWVRNRTGEKINLRLLLNIGLLREAGVWSDFINPIHNHQFDNQSIEKFSNGFYRIKEFRYQNGRPIKHRWVNPNHVEWAQVMIAAAATYHHPKRKLARHKKDLRLVTNNFGKTFSINYLPKNEIIDGRIVWRAEYSFEKAGVGVKAIDFRKDADPDILLFGDGRSFSTYPIHAFYYSLSNPNTSYKSFKGHRWEEENIQKATPNFKSLVRHGQKLIKFLNEAKAQIIRWGGATKKGQTRVYDFEMIPSHTPEQVFWIRVSLESKDFGYLSPEDITKIEVFKPAEADKGVFRFVYPQEMLKNYPDLTRSLIDLLD